MRRSSIGRFDEVASDLVARRERLIPLSQVTGDDESLVELDSVASEDIAVYKRIHPLLVVFPS